MGKIFPPSVRGTGHFILVAGATIVSLIAYGVLQERVMTIPYERRAWTTDGVPTGETGFAAWRGVLRDVFAASNQALTNEAREGREKQDLFSSSMFLVFVNRWMALIVSGLLATATGWGDETPAGGSKDYAAVSFSNLVATVCQYEVLKYLTFSVSTLAKTMKVVPVMIWVQILGHKKFSKREYVEAFLVTFGCFVFVSNRGWRSTVQKRYEGQYENTSMEWVTDIGFIILALYFVFDGFTSTYQQKMYRRDGVTVTAQVFFTSFFTTIFAFAWLLVTGQLAPSIRFVMEHRGVGLDILLLNVASTVAQFSIAYTIKSYSAVILASVMTFRQFISVLISCYIFSSPLNAVQWFGILFILAPAALKHVSFAGEREPASGSKPLLSEKNIPL